MSDHDDDMEDEDFGGENLEDDDLEEERPSRPSSASKRTGGAAASSAAGARESFIPADRRGLRACLLCSIIQKDKEFRRHGCPNCEEVLAMRGSDEKVAECTSTRFEGMIAMLNPEKSWVARWQRVDKFTRGLYAIKVIGVLPDGVVDDIEAAGITYSRRDGTEID
ncbi:hypothetical protein SmJEL517_g04265 [Synchytrium microbalum]|uniref:Transcription elongation factor SPT4 n=1 Tax=Synchytrium microbalum TaxID=1806994 RepID=A0A507C585_9FUNG|nr:uncharacterized protein SmJEL517_g04265 [Synchytrium microbalum]TPX32595.1 hypothetical protein SmJEL517_g04265 [Synchytrium microbalum]